MQGQLLSGVGGRGLDAAASATGCGCPACAAGPDGGFGAPAAGRTAPVAPVAPSADARVDGLLSWHKWAGPLVRYADPDSPFDYEPWHHERFSGFERIDAKQFAAIREALDAASSGSSVEGFTGLGVHYAGSGGQAELRFANTTDPGTAYAYLPGDRPEAGDVFFGGAGRAPVPGGYDHFTILHEAGHALGLKHGHEGGPFGALPSAYDTMEYSVMTYRSHVGASADRLVNEAFGFAQTYMMLDIAALQHLYGADFTTNSGDTTYSWSPATGRAFVDGRGAPPPGANRIFQTVWDGGGTDRFDLSNYDGGLRIDLEPGGSSTFAAAQLVDLGGGPNGGLARGNVFNALLHRGDRRSLIENAVGGGGDDAIRGNAAANALDGRGGADRLGGLGGSDRLAGGGGRDRLEGGLGGDVLAGGRGDDVLAGGRGDDVLVGGRGGDVLVGGRGGDVFRFGWGETGPGDADRIRSGDGAAAFGGAGRAWGDRIDLSGIDADAGLGGRQGFVFGEGAGVGQVWAVDDGARTLIRGDVGGGPGWEFELVVADRSVRASAYGPEDFIGLA